jgi:hypothetical protein
VAEAEPAFLCAIAWYGWTQKQTTGTLLPESWKLLQGYREVREQLAWLLLHSRPLRDAMLWLARHLVAIQFEPENAPGLHGQREHGALGHRLEHLLDVLRSELATRFSREAPSLLPWLDALEAFLRGLERPGAALLRFLHGPRGALTSLWLPHASLGFP